VTTNKPLILLVVVVFLGFYLLQDPTGFAAVVQDALGAAGHLVSRLFEALIDFLNALRD
jgi:hypothetical protein